MLEKNIYDPFPIYGNNTRYISNCITFNVSTYIHKELAILLCKSPPYATYMEDSCKILFKFMTYVNCYAIQLLRYAIIYSVVVILTVFDTIRGHVFNFILESYEQR